MKNISVRIPCDRKQLTAVNALITWIRGAVETCTMSQNKAKIWRANKMRTFAVSYIHHSTNRALHRECEA